MKRGWAIIAIPFIWVGCIRQPAPPQPPVACRVELSRLMSTHPLWNEIQSLEQRSQSLRVGLRSPLSLPRDRALPGKLSPIPSLQPAAKRSVPDTLSQLTSLREDAALIQEARMEQHQRERVAAESLLRQITTEAEIRQSRGQASENLWEQQKAVIRAYQTRITNLRMSIARLQDPAVIPEERAQQKNDLAKLQQELKDLERQRESELTAITQRVERQLAAEHKQRQQESERALHALEDELRDQREVAVATARQDWQDRMDTARTALSEAPPGPARPPTGSALAPTAAPRMRIIYTPSDSRGSEQTLAALLQSKTRLEKVISEETRRRVWGIAQRYNLAPHFDATGRGLPDRTEFFALQLREMGSSARSLR